MEQFELRVEFCLRIFQGIWLPVRAKLMQCAHHDIVQADATLMLTLKKAWRPSTAATELLCFNNISLGSFSWC